MQVARLGMWQVEARCEGVPQPPCQLQSSSFFSACLDRWTLISIYSCSLKN